MVDVRQLLEETTRTQTTATQKVDRTELIEGSLDAGQQTLMWQKIKQIFYVHRKSGPTSAAS